MWQLLGTREAEGRRVHFAQAGVDDGALVLHTDTLDAAATQAAVILRVELLGVDGGLKKDGGWALVEHVHLHALGHALDTLLAPQTPLLRALFEFSHLGVHLEGRR